MTNYFFKFIGKKPGSFDEDADHYCLFAIIDDKYYWSTEWFSDNILKKNIIQTVKGGFVTEEIYALCKNMSEIDLSVLRSQLGSLSYFIERAVNGFNSYIIWISPDPQVNDIPWQISNN